MIIIQFLFGASIASFFNLVAARWTRGESIVRPRSHCDSCGTQLENFDLIPVVSYIILKGRCRYCNKQFPATFFTVELAAGLAAASIDFQIDRWPFLLTLLLLLSLSSFDIVEQQIPLKGIGLLLLLCLVTVTHPLPHICMAIFVYSMIQITNHHFPWVGSGDIDIFFCLWLSSSVPFLLWLTFIACVAALFYLIVAPWPQDSKIPFVPFITIGYFVTQQLQDVLISLIS